MSLMFLGVFHSDTPVILIGSMVTVLFSSITPRNLTFLVSTMHLLSDEQGFENP
jgi:hypothetical protein